MERFLNFIWLDVKNNPYFSVIKQPLKKFFYSLFILFYGDFIDVMCL